LKSSRNLLPYGVRQRRAATAQSGADPRVISNNETGRRVKSGTKPNEGEIKARKVRGGRLVVFACGFQRSRNVHRVSAMCASIATLW
jgi:hypothetical protein